MKKQKSQNQTDQEFKTKFKADIEQESKEQELILNNYSGEGDIKPRPTF